MHPGRLLPLCLVCLAPSLLAQVDRAGLNGTVTDAAGRVLPGVRIVATETATGLERTAISTTSGSYDLPELPVGSYVIRFEHDGFATANYTNVLETVGRTRTLDVTLQAGGQSETIQVDDATSELNQTSNTIGTRIERKQADALPLNGRDWSELTAYAPGAVDTGGSNQRSVRFVGRGLDDSNFTLDGIDEGSVANQTQRPWARLSIPLDSIQEVRVDTLLATAEEGATGGAQLSVVSPSGTNQFHGRLFEFLRNDVFDAPEPTWASNGETQQPLRLNQFGGTLGGPILHGRTFFYITSEAYRQVWGYPVAGDVPSPAFRATIQPSSPVYGIINAYPTAGPKAILTPTTDPTIDLLTCACTQTVNENSVMARIDQTFSSKTTGFVRFNYDRAVNTQPVSTTATDLQQRVTTPVNGVVELLHVFNPYLTNEAKFGYNRGTSNQYNSSDTGSIYAIAVSSGPGVGFGTENSGYNSLYIGNTFSELDDLTWVHGRHTLKAGVEIREIQLNQSTGQHGTVTFANLASLANNQASRATLTGALPINDFRKSWFIGYVQDEWKLAENITLNLGARYSVFDLFHEAHGIANPFDFATCGAAGFCGIGASFGNQNYGDFDPRVGFSWSPGHDDKTVVRAGFGIYHEDGQMDDQNLPGKNETPSYQLRNTSYPITAAFPPGTLSPNAEDRNRKDSYVEQWGFSVQRQMPAHLVGTVSYLASHGVHLLETGYENLTLTPGSTVPQYPNFAAAIAWRGSVGASEYNGLIASLRRPFANGLLLTFNYTYAHELDNGSNGSGDGDETSAQNPLCQACDWGSGAWDARHVVNGNAVYQLPFGQGKQMLNHGIASWVAGNWQLTATALARTGFPVNVLLPSSTTSPYGNSGTLRPNRVPGVSFTPAGGRSIHQWINPLAFAAPAPGTFGNLARNAVEGPGTWQVDNGLAKQFPITERSHVEFRADFFNIFNHPQLGPPNATFTPGVSNVGAGNGFSSITNTVNLNTAIVSPITPVGSGTPREMQFALRFEF